MSMSSVPLSSSSCWGVESRGMGRGVEVLPTTGSTSTHFPLGRRDEWEELGVGVALGIGAPARNGLVREWRELGGEPVRVAYQAPRSLATFDPCSERPRS